MSCSTTALRLGEPVAGTAPTASAWLCVEQPGPWGARTPQESRLDPVLTDALTRAVSDTGVRVLLIRRPRRRQDDRADGTRVYLASTLPGRTWLRTALMTDTSDLLEVDYRAVGRGEQVPWGRPSADTPFLVCTNGRRDLCCALAGRRLATEAAVRWPEEVWECTHLGGHRFSPTALLLPTGYTYAHADIGLCADVLVEALAERIVLDRCRGRSSWDGAGQTAELALREHTGERAADAYTLTDHTTTDDEHHVHFRDKHDTRWHVTVRTRRSTPARPVSCAGLPQLPTTHLATAVESTAPHRVPDNAPSARSRPG